MEKMKKDRVNDKFAQDEDKERAGKWRDSIKDANFWTFVFVVGNPITFVFTSLLCAFLLWILSTVYGSMLGTIYGIFASVVVCSLVMMAGITGFAAHGFFLVNMGVESKAVV